MGDLNLGTRAVLQPGGELSHEAVRPNYIVTNVKVDPRLLFDLLDQILQEWLWIFAIDGGVHVAQIAAQFVFAFHEVNVEATMG